MQSNKRLPWIDGLRGIACLLVFIHHFMLTFYPASYYGTERVSILSGFDTLLSYHPIGFIINGNFWVMVFILIAAFIPASRVMSAKSEDCKSVGGTIILRRYPRLMLPIAVVALFKYILTVVLTHFGLNYTGITIENGFIKYMFHAMVMIFFRVDSSVIGPLWSIYYIFMAVPFAVMLALPCKKSNRFMPLIYAALVVPVYYAQVNFTPIIFGVLLADIKVNRLEKFKTLVMSSSRKILALPILLVTLLSCYLGGYPSHDKVPTTFYALLPRLGEQPIQILYHAAGAFFLTLGIMLWHEANLSTVILCRKPALFLGRLAMGIFLIHSLVIDYLGYWLYDTVIASLGNPVTSGLIVLVVATVLVISLAYIFNICAERPIDKLCKKIKV